MPDLNLPFDAVARAIVGADGGARPVPDLNLPFNGSVERSASIIAQPVIAQSVPSSQAATASGAVTGASWAASRRA